MIDFSPSSIALYVVFFILILFSLYIYFRGQNSICIRSLTKPNYLPDSFVVYIFLAISYVLSFVGLYLAGPYLGRQQQFVILLFNDISSYALALWTISAFNLCQLDLSLFFIVIAFSIYVGLTIYIGFYSVEGAILQIPYIIWLVYILYSTGAYAIVNTR
jgi:tryptophan-rich sensory protein